MPACLKQGVRRIEVCHGPCEQGRLTENTKTVNKDDLLAMVRYGAEMVFSSEVRCLLPNVPSVPTMHWTIMTLIECTFFSGIAINQSAAAMVQLHAS